jgi:membrane protein
VSRETRTDPAYTEDPSVKERVTGTVGDVRERAPVVDHLIRMVQHYGLVKGSVQAGAVTFFGFLSFFPILALAFAVVGMVSNAVPDAQDTLVKAIGEILPGIVGNKEGQIQLSAIEEAAPGIFSVGLLVVLYSGLGWLSGMRDALLIVFEKPPKEQPNFVIGKLSDLAALASIGLTLILSVTVSGVLVQLSGAILGWLGLAAALTPLVVVLSLVVGLAANSLLFFVMFKILARPDAPNRSLWSGALLGAVGFEVLKQLSAFLLSSTKEQPAFQAFGIALILLIWINYFSRVVMYAASWAHTSPAARLAREEEARQLEASKVDLKKPRVVEAGTPKKSLATAYAAGGVSALGLVALLRRKKES